MIHFPIHFIFSIFPVLLILSILDCRCVVFFCHLIRDFDFYIGLRPREPKRKTVDCVSHNATPRFQPFSPLWPESQKLWSCAGFFLTSHLCERHNKKPVYVFFFFFKRAHLVVSRPEECLGMPSRVISRPFPCRRWRGPSLRLSYFI